MYLASETFVANIRGRAVVLDLAQDKYLALAPEISGALQSLIEGGKLSEEAMALAPKLRSAGFISDAPGRRADRVARAPTRSQLPPSRVDFARRPQIHRSDSTRALISLLQAHQALTRLAFRETIGWVDREPVRARAARSLPSVLEAFYQIRPWFPVKPICRLDALALTVFLRRCGHGADLVFGVTLEPFAAHCWVQCADQVINEGHDRVDRYTPILVV